MAGMILYLGVWAIASGVHLYTFGKPYIQMREDKVNHSHLWDYDKDMQNITFLKIILRKEIFFLRINKNAVLSKEKNSIQG